jgi:hypothetical protein
MATAHRRLSREAREWLPDELLRIAGKLRNEHGTETGCSGMALGGDMLWADAVLTVGLKLWAHVPFPDQAKDWPPKHQDRWIKLFASAHRETVYGDDPDHRLFHARNDGMLNESAAIIAVWDPASDRRSGTRSTVRKALNRGLPVVWINPAAEPGQRCARMARPETLRRLLAD